MTAPLPDPLVPAEVDLRDFQYMPLDVRRLRDSRLVSTRSPEEVVAAILLWSSSWHQSPAASLPDDDVELSAMRTCGTSARTHDCCHAVVLAQPSAGADGPVRRALGRRAAVHQIGGTVLEAERAIGLLGGAPDPDLRRPRVSCCVTLHWCECYVVPLAAPRPSLIWSTILLGVLSMSDAIPPRFDEEILGWLRQRTNRGWTQCHPRDLGPGEVARVILATGDVLAAGSIWRGVSAICESRAGQGRAAILGRAAEVAGDHHGI